MKYSIEQIRKLISSDAEELSVSSVEESYIFCRKLAKSHYENFPVGSLIINKPKRKYFYSIYNFARIADDIADEEHNLSSKEKINLLDQMITNISLLQNSNSPLIISVRDTLENTNITNNELSRLVTAFKMDADFNHPKNWDEILKYCHLSANPVGEMLLKLFEEDNKETIEKSDNICSALQLINFWQDISVDIKKGRVYIPKDLFNKNNITQDEFFSNKEKSEIILGQLLEYSSILLEKGIYLIYLIKNKRLKLEISLIVSSGNKMLSKLYKNINTLTEERPGLNTLDRIQIFFNALSLYFSNGKRYTRKSGQLRKS